jgi:hypothetical protein
VTRRVIAGMAFQFRVQADLLQLLAGRLLLRVVVVRMGDFIASLQIVGATIERLSLRMPAQLSSSSRRSLRSATLMRAGVRNRV